MLNRAARGRVNQLRGQANGGATAPADATQVSNYAGSEGTIGSYCTHQKAPPAQSVAKERESRSHCKISAVYGLLGNCVA